MTGGSCAGQPDFLIRPMEEQDIPAAAGIENRCFSMPWSEAEIRRSLMNRKLYRFYAAEQEGSLAGYCAMSLILDEADIDNVAVLPEYRRQGIGRAMMARMIKDAQEYGCTAMVLEVRESNLPAIRLYESFGFRRIGLRRDYYRDPTENALLYGLSLHPDGDGGSGGTD